MLYRSLTGSEVWKPFEMTSTLDRGGEILFQGGSLVFGVAEIPNLLRVGKAVLVSGRRRTRRGRLGDPRVRPQRPRSLLLFQAGLAEGCKSVLEGCGMSCRLPQRKKLKRLLTRSALACGEDASYFVLGAGPSKFSGGRVCARTYGC